MYTVALDPLNLDSLAAPLLQPSSSSSTSSPAAPVSFDGTMAYAQHKRCQVELTERWAQCSPPGLCFLSMHPGLAPLRCFFYFCHVCLHCLGNALMPAAGWADTPGVATAMPGFRAKFESSLRSSEQGADTVIWLATRPNDFALENGAFYFDRSVAKKHLPLAGTQVRDGRRGDLWFVFC